MSLLECPQGRSGLVKNLLDLLVLLAASLLLLGDMFPSPLNSLYNLLLREAVEFRFSACLQTPSAISEALLAAVLGNHLDQGLEQGNLEEYMGLIHHEQLDLDSPR